MQEIRTSPVLQGAHGPEQLCVVVELGVDGDFVSSLPSAVTPAAYGQ